MHIVVCIKQVPDSAQIRVHPVTNTIMRQGVPTILNPYDLFALEAALRLRDQFKTNGTEGVLFSQLAARHARVIAANRVDTEVFPLVNNYDIVNNDYSDAIGPFLTNPTARASTRRCAGSVSARSCSATGSPCRPSASAMREAISRA